MKKLLLILLISTIAIAQDRPQAKLIYDINWNNLKVILIAPDFFDRDLTAGKYDPLKSRIHFYSFNVVLTRKKNIFGLSMKYLGPDDEGPMYLPSVTDKNNLVDLYKRFNELSTKESKRDYYTNFFIPIFDKIKEKVVPYFNEHNLHFHTSYFNSELPYFMIRIGTQKKKTHASSIFIGFSDDSIEYGFKLRGSETECPLLSQAFKDDLLRSKISESILSLSEYYLYIPISGFDQLLFIEDMSMKAMSMILQSYDPPRRYDGVILICKDHESPVLSYEDASEILIDEHKKFKFLFDILQGK